MGLSRADGTSRAGTARPVATCAAALLLLAAPRAAGEEIHLFNGRDLTGFTTWLRDTGPVDPRGVFSVVRGSIRISGDGYGYLATTRSFRNYRLRLDFRWGDQANLDRGTRRGKALDSGVFLHANGPDGNSHDGDGAYMAAIECNVFEGATGDFLLIRGNDKEGKLIAPRLTVEGSSLRDRDGFPWWEPGGVPVNLERWGRVNWLRKPNNWEDRRGMRGPQDVENPPGKWNRLECHCKDDQITIILNGQTVNHVTRVFPRAGKILLQCEGAEVFYRNLVIELPDEP